MNDSIIINTISKIHFALVTILSFIFLLLFFSFIALQNGVTIDSISLKNIQAKKLYIKWDEKISLSAKELNIKKDSNVIEIDYEGIVKEIKNALLFATCFNNINIESISYGDFKGSFNYIEDENSYLKIHSDIFELESLIKTDGHIFDIDIVKIRSKTKNITADAKIIFDLRKKIEAASNINLYIGDTTLHINAISDTKSLSYNITSKSDIKNKKEIVELFDLDSAVRYWVDDAINITSLSLKSMYGSLEYDDLDNAYLKINAKAVANNLIYTYDKELAPVKSSFTNLEFKNGVLYIRPQNAYSYNFFLDKSWLKIDFSQKEEILSLYLLFNAQANNDILSLLNHYGIKLPFVQTKGELKTDLHLDINLRTLGVEALGNFYTKEAQIHYLGMDIDIFDVKVGLKNSYAWVEKMYAKYSNIATAYVDLKYDASASKGELVFHFDNIALKENDIALEDNRPLLATYIIDPKGDSIKIDKSHWVAKKEDIFIDALKMPFDIKNPIATLPPTNIKIKNIGSATINGEIDLREKKLNLEANLLNLDNNIITFYGEKNIFNIRYDDELKIVSNGLVSFDLFGKNCTIKNFAADISKNNIYVQNADFSIEDILHSKFNAKHDFNSSVGIVDIYSLSAFEKMFENNEGMQFIIKKDGEKTKISSQKYELSAEIDDNSWRVYAASLEKITKKSDIFKKYDLANGSLLLKKEVSSQNIEFNMLVQDTKHKILTQKNLLIDDYSINGKYNTQTEGIVANINDLVDIDIAQNIEIKAHDTGFNLDAILEFFSSEEDEVKQNSNNKKDDRKSIELNAKNCYIYVSDNRYLVSDTIDLKYKNDILDIKLNHKNGEAKLELKDDKFYFFGDKFGDEFMQNLFAMSKFKGGVLRFSMDGAIKDFGGILYVENTTVLDYKILNNILAFVNTVPSLVTFSLPGYNINGLKTKNAYIKFKYKDDLYTISDVYLKSKEIEIVGTGEASVIKNSINMELNLKTDLGSSFSKIPLIGNLILGNENISTTLSVNGKLEDPTINTQITKDIMVAPLNIIKRTLMYPFELFKSDDKE
ncbi:MAG: hypothetical protein QG559_627 [Campylobacterota bacterium]|nr:hypothetical protein [Campylobacterota bacterium]